MATFNSIASAAKTVLEGLSGAPTVDIRKTFVVHPRESLPLCVISYGNDETDAWGTTGSGASDAGTTGKRFQLIITYLATSLGDTQSDTSTVPDFWQAAKRAFNLGSLSGVSSVWNVDIETHEAWDGQAFGEGHEKSEMVLIVDVAEGRNG